MDYPQTSMAALVFETAQSYPTLRAWEYFGFHHTYAALARDIRHCAAALSAIGVREGTRVVVSLPNCPQAVTLLYALNALGAVAVFTHPLSAPEEMAFYLSSSRAEIAVTLYQFYDDLRDVFRAANLRRVILTAPLDMLPIAGFARLREKMPQNVLPWHRFWRLGGTKSPDTATVSSKAHDIAVVLYSGGTSGMPKGIALTNLNFNALARGTIAAGGNIEAGGRMLAVMPMFHGFGLGVCVHTSLVAGLCALLVPRFTVASYAKILSRRRVNYIAGVPTLFEALLRLPNTAHMRLGTLRGVFSGGDSLPTELHRRLDAFLTERGSPVRVREGYGLTESVTACCLTPPDGAPDGSIGLPFEDTRMIIVAPNTTDELPRGETGEILVSSPLVMPRYDDDETETAQALITLPDGRVWLRTGDLGSMDERGFLYFRGRLKRVIVSSGYNVYPHHVETVLNAVRGVAQSCVVGVPDDYRMQRVVAFIVVDDNTDTAALETALRERCRAALAPQSRPREYRFIDALPRTRVGKVDYGQLTVDS
ncbi:MAG: acyl--CoA ligase [Oscillospiraceae bacterium]|jgi:long-chain acyl-CoA synthetase|nr:acyl--CoA ligase [Oscillospiraceae bacterium]